MTSLLSCRRERCRLWCNACKGSGLDSTPNSCFLARELANNSRSRHQNGVTSLPFMNTFPEDFASLSPSDFLSRLLSLLCSSLALQGPRQRRQTEKGRPFLLMRISGRSGKVSQERKMAQKRPHEAIASSCML